MCQKKNENKVENTIGELTPEQQALQQQLAMMSQNLGGQMGDLSGLASGNLSSLNPEIAALIQQSQAAARQNAQFNYQDAIRSGRSAASASGIDGSTAEALSQAMAGRTRDQTLAGLDSQGASMQMQLPFQLAGTQLQANSLLQQGYGQSSGSLLNALLQQQLGQGTRTETQTQDTNMLGMLIGGASQVGSAYAGKPTG